MRSSAHAAAAAAQAPGAAQSPRRRGRRRWVLAGAVAVLVTAGTVAGVARSSAAKGGRPGSIDNSYPTSLATVTRRSLSSQTGVDATLGYTGSCTVTGKGGGTITWLPAAGQVIRQGQVLYRVGNGTPVILLYGTVPDWRALGDGASGADVSQLNHDLVALGDASSTEIANLGWDYFSWETGYGLERLQSALGVSDPSGSLPLGQAVFEPGALRATTVTAQLGGPASGPVLTATSTTPVVTIALDAAQQTEVKAGDTVTITLPDGTTTPGVISSVGTVATTSSSGSGSSSSSATIPVQVRLTDPKAVGGLDQAPVTVDVTTASVNDALVVPVTALLAMSGGGYAVEVTGTGGVHHLAGVTVGIFDDTDGLVQVSGPGLAAGQRVVVPGT